MAEQFINFAKTTLNGSLSATSLSIVVADGSHFPTVDFYIVIENENANREIVWVASRSSNTLTVPSISYRGLKSTTAILHPNGASVVHTLLAHHFNDFLHNAAVFIPGRPQGSLFRQYNFDSTVEGFTTTSGTLSSTSGTLQLVGGSESIALEDSGVTSLADGEFSLDMKLVAGKDAGFIVRATDASNYYLISVRRYDYTPTSDGIVTLYKRVAGTYSYLTQGNISGLGANSQVRMLARFVGGDISVYMNDTLMISTYDTTFTTGRVGIRAYDSSVTVQADNMKLYSLPASWTPSWAGGQLEGGIGSIGVASRIRTAGDYTLNHAGSFIAVDTGLDLTLDAKVGDLLEYSISGLLETGSPDNYFDIATIVSGSIIRYFSSGTSTVAAGGVNGWYCAASAIKAVTGSAFHTVQANDLEGGQVKLRLVYRQSSASNRTFYATPDDPLQLAAKNLSAVVINNRTLQATGKLNSVSVSRTAGDLTLNNTSWTDVSTSLDLALSAKVGDVIEYGINAVTGNENVYLVFDVATIVGGSPANYFSTATSSTANDGCSGWFCNIGIYDSISGSHLYTLKANDIVNGQILLRLRFRTLSGANKLLNSNTDVPLHVYAKNLSAIVFDGMDALTGPVQKWDADAQPLLVHYLDDEFNDVSLSVAWTEFDVGNDTTVSQSNGFLSLDQPALGSGNHISGVYKLAPSGDYSITTRALPYAQMIAAKFPEWGIMLGQNITGAPSTSDVITVDVAVSDPSNSGWINGVNLQADYATYSSTYFQVTSATIPSHLRFRKIGSTGYMDISQDGLGWLNIGSFTLPWTPAEIGLFVRGHDTSVASTKFDYFRVSTDTSMSAYSGRKVVSGLLEPDNDMHVHDALWTPVTDNILGLDDEFNDHSIHSSWNTYVGGGSATWKEAADVVSVKFSGQSGGGEVCALLKSVGSLVAPYYIETCLSAIWIPENYHIVNMIMSDGLISSSNTTSIRTYYNGSWNMDAGRGTLAGLVPSGPDQFGLQSIGFPGKIHFRLAYESANTFHGWFSPDGVTWISMSSSYSKTMTPTHFGLAVTCQGASSVKMNATYEYFRVRTGIPA